MSGASSVLAEKRTPTDGGPDPTGKVQALEMELQLAKEALISKLNGFWWMQGLVRGLKTSW